jgi:hypothetical protein
MLLKDVKEIDRETAPLPPVLQNPGAVAVSTLYKLTTGPKNTTLTKSLSCA